VSRAAVFLAVLAAAISAAVEASAAPLVHARAYLVSNPATGEILAARAPDLRVPVASITKLMTVYVALQHLGLDQVVTVSAPASAVGESSIYLRSGERMSVRDLVAAALVQSANDAADALADAAAGGDRARFVAWMNAEARRLGLEHTHFARPDGLDTRGHLSTARDVTRLARAVMRLEVVREDVALRETTISGGRVLTTWNDLLGVFPGVVGVKTGHTGGAGWCEVALVRRPPLSLYATILGSPAREVRNRDLAALLRFGLSSYQTATVVPAGEPLAEVATGYGETVAVAAPSALTVPIRVARPVVEKLVLPGRLELPVSRGQYVGEVRVYSNGKLVGKRSLLALEAVSKPNLLGKVGWYGQRTIDNLFGWM
jgi:D-alanyl-D-alanine carboxypeptidase (penicillin-binding protein 5/6)